MVIRQGSPQLQFPPLDENARFWLLWDLTSAFCSDFEKLGTRMDGNQQW
jgi:hypothetical protein